MLLGRLPWGHLLTVRNPGMFGPWNQLGVFEIPTTWTFTGFPSRRKPWPA